MANSNQVALNALQQRLRVIPFIWRWLGLIVIFVLVVLSSINVSLKLFSLNGEADVVCAVCWGLMIAMHYIFKPVTADETIAYWSDRKVRRRGI